MDALKGVSRPHHTFPDAGHVRTLGRSMTETDFLRDFSQTEIASRRK